MEAFAVIATALSIFAGMGMAGLVIAATVASVQEGDSHASGFLLGVGLSAITAFLIATAVALDSVTA